MKKLIGIEREYFLLNEDDEIVEPKAYGYPIDEFGFLVEIRTEPYDNVDDIINDFNKKLALFEESVKRDGLKLVCAPRMIMKPEQMAYFRKKYKWETLPDLTANIYHGINRTHATGVDGNWVTAGMHVHFSYHDDEGRRVQLPIWGIVRDMDFRFIEWINETNRNPGEFEIKPWGWEYRALPTDASLRVVLEWAFKLLNESTKYYTW